MKFRLDAIVIVLLICLLAWVVLNFPSCSQDHSPNANIEAKKESAAKAETLYVKEKEKAEKVIEYRDSIVYRYKTIRKDSLIPCPEKLILCDSALYASDSLINSLKGVIQFADSAIGKKNELIDALTDENESLLKVNKSLSKKLKRARFWNKILAAVGIGATTAALTNR